VVFIVDPESMDEPKRVRVVQECDPESRPSTS